MFLLHFCKNWNRFIHIYVFASEIKYRYSNVASFSTLPFRPHSRAAHLARCLCCAFAFILFLHLYIWIHIHMCVYIIWYISKCIFVHVCYIILIENQLKVVTGLKHSVGFVSNPYGFPYTFHFSAVHDAIAAAICIFVFQSIVLRLALAGGWNTPQVTHTLFISLEFLYTSFGLELLGWIKYARR